MRTLDRCYIPQALMRHFGVETRDLLGPEETPALRRVFITLLERVDRLNLAARGSALPGAKPAFAGGDDVHLPVGGTAQDRLAKGDPLAARVALTKLDGAFSLLRALGALVWP